MTSRDPKGQTRDPNTLRAQYLENSHAIICGFKQKLQWIYPRIDRFWQCRN